MNIILADPQEITRAGLLYLCKEMNWTANYSPLSKHALLQTLEKEQKATVIIDFTLFDIADMNELLLISERFEQVHWILFCDELREEMVRILMASSPRFSFVLKYSPLAEIENAIREAMTGRSYVCRRMAETLAMHSAMQEEIVPLTKTETEILKDMALGYTTKEIAERRFSSFHTVNTHRKNIFRKIRVNTVHEATKYALRAGLVDAAEYYI